MLSSTETDIEAILPVMNSNELVVEIRHKKTQAHTGPKLFFQALFSTTVHIYDLYIFTVIINQVDNVDWPP